MQHDIPEPEIEIKNTTFASKRTNDSMEFLQELKRFQMKSDWDGLYLLEDMIED
jgi:hypothetical protein